MLQIKTGTISESKIDSAAVLVCEDKLLYEDKKTNALIRKVKKLDESFGRKKQRLVYHDPVGIPANRVIFLGIGKYEDMGQEIFRSAAGQAVMAAMENKLSSLSVIVPDEKKIKMPFSGVVESLMEGACLANHSFDKYKKEPKSVSLKDITFYLDTKEIKQFKDTPAYIETLCQGTVLARDWVTMPSNDKRPEMFAKMIAAAAKKEKLAVTIWTKKMLQQKKFGALMAVAAGSDQEPRMAIVKYSSPKATKTVALVGKGVTFDSGGLNLKSSAGIGNMKIDMAGAAAVAAFMVTVGRLKPAVNVIGVIPIVENMPSGHAYRPGDVVTSYAGKTIEIGNTDAEGRLILADALAYTVKTFKPDVLIDLATLTGACMVALGDKIAGVFSKDEALAQAIVAAGEKTAERCWQMPLPEDYRELMKSDLADIRNMSRSQYGGAITAALFLSEFTGTSRWAHIDIAGPASNEKPSDYCPIGGSGFGVRLLWTLINTLD